MLELAKQILMGINFMNMNKTQPKQTFLTKRMLYTRLLIIFLAIPIALFSSPYVTDHWLGYAAMKWLGYFLIATCVLGRSFCTVFIGGRKTYSLVALGPYSLVRNPLYVFSFFGILGICLEFGMITILIMTIILFFSYYSVVIAREEAWLTSNFGEKYKEYTKKVPRWIPRTLKMSMPETIEAAPRKVLKTMLDSSLFFLALPALELLDYLHKTGILPVLFRLP